MSRQVIAQNRKARHDYFIEDTFEAGIVLEGSEVKSLRSGKANINDAYASAEKGELYLLNAHIGKYEAAKLFNHEEKRPRKLLVSKRELKCLIGAVQKKGITLIPLVLYFNGRGIAKIEIGIASGKKQIDKRATEKEREWQRDKARLLKNHA